jgi:hypothetical protein
MRILIIFLLTITSFNVSAESSRAWWVDFKLEPKKKEILGIPASTVDKRFHFIEILQCGAEATLSNSQCSSIDEHGLSLKYHGDFDSNGDKEYWHIAVAKGHDGGYYKVALSINSSGDLLFSLTQRVVKPGFSVFLKRNSLLSWVMCMECGHLADIIWEGGAPKLDWGEDYGNFNMSKHSDLVKLSPFLYQKNFQLHQTGV